MMMNLLGFVCVALVAVAASGCAGPSPAMSSAPGRAIVVRHAEASAALGSDPELTVGGRERAFALAEALQQAGVKAIFASQFRRTQQTARPLAEILGVEVEEIAVVGGDIEAQAAALARRIREEHPGETVLIVGHSNTVPLIVQALCGVSVRPLRDDQYGDLFIVDVATPEAQGDAGRGSVIHARFGQ
jgi:phosphohistidine phosphatase SixA